MIAKEKKCEFFKDTLEFLGHTIMSNGIVPDDLKIPINLWQNTAVCRKPKGKHRNTKRKDDDSSCFGIARLYERI